MLRQLHLRRFRRTNELTAYARQRLHRADRDSLQTHIGGVPLMTEPDRHDTGDFAALGARLQDFALTRDWLRNHNPKNLGVSLAIEVGELLEHFQWLTDDQASQVKHQPEKMADVR